MRGVRVGMDTEGQQGADALSKPGMQKQEVERGFNNLRWSYRAVYRPAREGVQVPDVLCQELDDYTEEAD